MGKRDENFLYYLSYIILKGKYYVGFLEELTIAHGAEDVTTNYTNCIITVVIYIKVQA